MAPRVYSVRLNEVIVITDKDREVILKEMFSRVGLEYSKDMVSKPNWYQETTWTNAEQDAFIKWLTKYIQKKTKFTKEYCEKQAQWFNLHCGWKVKDI